MVREEREILHLLSFFTEKTVKLSEKVAEFWEAGELTTLFFNQMMAFCEIVLSISALIYSLSYMVGVFVSIAKNNVGEEMPESVKHLYDWFWGNFDHMLVWIWNHLNDDFCVY